jgi:hypothetical protein
MSNVIQFPERASIRIIEGTTVDTGMPIYLLEYVEGGSNTIVGEYFSLVDLAHSILEWEKDGIPIAGQPDGAA